MQAADLGFQGSLDVTNVQVLKKHPGFPKDSKGKDTLVLTSSLMKWGGTSDALTRGGKLPNLENAESAHPQSH